MSTVGMEPQFCACAPYLVGSCFLSLIVTPFRCSLPFSPPLFPLLFSLSPPLPFSPSPFFHSMWEP